MLRFVKTVRSFYEPLIVVVTIAAAGLLTFALYHATRGSAAKKTQISFVASFNDVTGIKEHSKVLFKGMPVGTVGEMAYDTRTDKVLVRIDIRQPVHIPANIQPYLESSFFGDSHIALKTDDTGHTKQSLAEAAGKPRRDVSKLYRIEGVQLSKADAILPGFGASAMKTMEAAGQAVVQVQELASISKRAVSSIYSEMNESVILPVKDCTDELRRVIEGPVGRGDQHLAGELQSLVNDLEKNSTALNELFQGTGDGHAKGLLQLGQEAGGDWSKVTQRMVGGTEKAFIDLRQMADSLDKAGKAISRSETQLQKLGEASEKLGIASRSVESFVEMLKLKPNAVVWGMNDAQQAMTEQHRAVERKTGKQRE